MVVDARAASTPWQLFRQVAVRYGDRVAITRGSEALTFRNWLDGSIAYASAYAERGFSPGGRVLLWTETSPSMACALTGAWAARGIPALIDPRSGVTHFQHALDTVTPHIIVTDADSELTGPNADARVMSHADVPTTGFITDVGRGFTPRQAGREGPPYGYETGSKQPVDAVVPDPCALPDEPASIVFTSGSTGRPKGVTQSHGNLLRGCLAVNGYLGLTPEDRILCTVPWSFDYGYGQLLTSALQGVTLILPSANNPIGMCEAIERHRPTLLAGVPSVFTYLLRGVSPFRTTDLSSIRTVTNTGGRVPPPILEELFAMLPQAQFFLNYGLTETYRTSCLDPSLARQRPASIGKPIPGVDVAIIREDGSITAANEVGEIVHRGDYVFLGYWNDAEATAKTLRPDPLAPAGSPARAVFTGDLGYRDEDGFLFFTGRRDHLLKSMGVRVGPGDVEDLLYRSGLVKEAAVVGRKHELFGDEVCAFVVPVDDVENAAFQLGQYARRAMSPYMVPRRFFILSELPKTANRKIDYPTLRHLAATDAAGAGSANP